MNMVDFSFATSSLPECRFSDCNFLCGGSSRGVVELKESTTVQDVI